MCLVIVDPLTTVKSGFYYFQDFAFIKITVVPDANIYELYGISGKHLSLFELLPLGWIEIDGNG